MVWGHGAGRLTYDNTVPTLSLFGAGIVFFTVHYLMLRGFYALEQTRTVFLIQCAVGLTNIVAALVLVGLSDDEHTAPALVLAYTASYVVGSIVSYSVLRRRLGGLETPALVGFLVVLLIITVGTTAVAFGVGLGVHSLTDRSALGDRGAAGRRDHVRGRRRLRVAGPPAPAARGHLGGRSGAAADSGRAEALTVLR